MVALVAAKPVLVAQMTRDFDSGHHAQTHPRSTENNGHLLYQSRVPAAAPPLEFKLPSKIIWSKTDLFFKLPNGVPPMPHVRVGLIVAQIPHDR